MDEIIQDCWSKGFGFHQTWEIVRHETGKYLSKTVWEAEQKRHNQRMIAFFEKQDREFAAAEKEHNV